MILNDSVLSESHEDSCISSSVRTGVKSRSFSTSFIAMKEVEKLLDLTPVLTEELMQLSSWLSDKTLSFKITALQAMLPAALKAKYEPEAP